MTEVGRRLGSGDAVLDDGDHAFEACAVLLGHVGAGPVEAHLVGERGRGILGHPQHIADELVMGDRIIAASQWRNSRPSSA